LLGNIRKMMTILDCIYCNLHLF